ncbi:MAG: hypothetical protein AAF408_00780 [Pseudomonadota bacterium]
MTPEQQIAISKRLKKIARLIDKELSKAAGETVPFSLFVWCDNRSQYVANITRSDAMLVLQETLDRWKRNEPDLGPPHMDGQGEPMQ